MSKGRRGSQKDWAVLYSNSLPNSEEVLLRSEKRLEEDVNIKFEVLNVIDVQIKKKKKKTECTKLEERGQHDILGIPVVTCN